MAKIASTTRMASIGKAYRKFETGGGAGNRTRVLRY